MNNMRLTCTFALITLLAPTLTATTAFAQAPAA